MKLTKYLDLNIHIKTCEMQLKWSFERGVKINKLTCQFKTLGEQRINPKEIERKKIIQSLCDIEKNKNNKTKRLALEVAHFQLLARLIKENKKMCYVRYKSGG